MESQIIELEKKYWQGMEDHDYETVKNLTRFPCIIASKHGVQSVDEPSFKRMFESGEGNKIKVVNISDVESQQIGANTVGIAYVVELTSGNDDKTSKCACTSTWVNDNNNWVCFLHTETELEN